MYVCLGVANCGGLVWVLVWGFGLGCSCSRVCIYVCMCVCVIQVGALFVMCLLYGG